MEISYRTRPHKSARFGRAPIKTSPVTKRAVERRTLPRKLELFKARTGSPRTKKTEVVCHATEKKKKKYVINLPLLTSALLSSELFFNVKTYGTNDISSHTAHTCVYTLNQKDVLALKIGPFRWVKYSPIFGSNLAPLNQDQYSPIS